mgnify:CR=1 FL=1
MSRKNFLIVLIALIVSANLIIFLKPNFSGKVVSNSEDLEKGFVTKIIDGDTIIVGGESIRLLGIDSDERGGKCYKEAKERMEELALNKEVLLERDVKDKDQYKRLLRWIFVENNGVRTNLNLVLVEEGLAVARFYEDRKYKDEILKAEQKARENKIGCKWRDL